MLPSDQSNEQLFQQMSSKYHQQNIIIPKNRTLAHNSMDGSNFSNSARESQRQKLFVSDNYGNTTCDHNHQKKMMHRDLEKHRRQEMSSLHASLRSLLPLEYIKGKRSMSDHLNEAVNYIKDQKNKIKELSAKRDELKKSSDFNVSSPASGSRNNNLLSHVMVHPCLGGLEVVISSSYKEQGLSPSKVLEVLLKEGLDVVNCVSTKVNDQILLFLTIHAQASDPRCADLSGLQQKLTEVMTPSLG